jgi:ParB-like chromosome segregation protein Spo0J
MGSRQTERLLRLPLECLHPHPANPNRMDEDRPHPQEQDAYQVLDGNQRWEVLKRLGHEQALCYVWPCDDRTALVMLATLNRLEGTDEPLKRAELLRDLASLMPVDELSALLPEDATAIHHNLELLESDLEALLAEFEKAPSTNDSQRAITFVVTAEDEATIEEAVAVVASRLEGTKGRGRALAEIARAYLASKEDWPR